MHNTRSAASDTSDMSCSTMITVMPRSFWMSSIQNARSRVSSGLSPEAGSSSSSRRGCVARARANSTTLRTPYGRPATGLLRCGIRSSSSITSSTWARDCCSARRTAGVHNHCAAKLPWSNRCRPSSRLSSTLPPSNSSMFWKVRAMPACTTLCRGRRVMSWPSNSIWPAVGSKTRVITLSIEVLPAPLGPMMANTSPCSTSKLTLWTACTPPKRSETSRTANRLICSAPTSCSSCRA